MLWRLAWFFRDSAVMGGQVQKCVLVARWESYPGGEA